MGCTFMYFSLLSLTYLISIITHSLVAQIIGPQEYCTHDTFNASCPINHVIVMETAFYGRMRFGRCMQEDHGHVGCSANILSVLDAQCSGNRRCSVSVPIANVKVQECPKELMHYLEASYRCQTVEPSIECSRHQKITLKATNKTKYLAPHISNARGVSGTKHCPWIITTEPGRQINLTIFNFNTDTYTETLECHQFAVIKDNNVSSEKPICNDNRRESLFYISMSQRIELYIVSRGITKQSPKLLLTYKGIGCANIEKMDNAWIMREEDTLVVKCNRTGETFFLSCTGTHWLGQLHNCSAEITSKTTQPNGRSTQFRYGWLLLIGIGVALGVALGIILLAAILAFFRRKKQDEKMMNVSRHTSDPLLSEITGESDDMSNYYERRVQALATIGPRSPRIPRDSIYKDRCSVGGMGAHFHTLPRNYNQVYGQHQQPTSSRIHTQLSESPYCTCVQQQQPPPQTNQMIPPPTESQKGSTSAQTSFITFKPGDPRNPNNTIESFLLARIEVDNNNEDVDHRGNIPPPCGTGVRHITAARSLDLLKDSDHSIIARKDCIIASNKKHSVDDPRCTCTPMLGPTPVLNGGYQSNGYFDNSNNKSI